MNTYSLATGERLAYQDEGRGPPILLIHGWGVSGRLFAPQVAALAGRFRLVVPDMLGHGESNPFTPETQFSRMADSLAGLISHLELRSVCVVGWSMGALVGWDLLRRYPQLDIAGVVTVDMVPRVLNGQGWSLGLREGKDHHVFDRHLALMRSDWPAFAELFISRMFAPGNRATRTDLLEAAKREALRNDPNSMANIWAVMVEQDFTAEVARFDQPSLVLSGSHSSLYGSAAGRWLSEHLPQARWVEFAESGHAPNMEQPEEFNRELSAFVDSLHVNHATTVNTPVSTGTKT